MKDRSSAVDIDARWADAEGMQAAMRRGVRAALLRQKKLGESIAEWRDGHVVIVPPEEIEVDEEPPRA